MERLHEARMRRVVESLVEAIKADVTGPLARLNDVELNLARQLIDADLDDDLPDVGVRLALSDLIDDEASARGLSGRPISSSTKRC